VMPDGSGNQVLLSGTSDATLETGKLQVSGMDAQASWSVDRLATRFEA
jgi:hypothetical protein